MRILHKAFCAMGWHRFTPWVETKYNPQPPSNATHMERIVYLTQGYIYRQRTCSLCGRREEIKQKLFP